MYFALLTALFWTFGGFSSSRIARHFGAAPANGLRLLFASVLLTGLVGARGWGSLPPHWGWFALAGLLHLSVGDLALFAAYRRLGPRLGVLMVASLAPVFAMMSEWLLLGTMLTPAQLLCAVLIVVSVGFAVAPRERMHLNRVELRRGLLAGVIAGLGQGVSQAVNRLGFVMAAEAGEPCGPYWAALLRVTTGAVGVWVWIALLQVAGRAPLRRPVELIPHKRLVGSPWGWLALSTLLGPFLGMLCLMEALRTTPSALVQTTLSTLPVFMIPVAWWLDGNAPSKRSAVVGILAVAWTVLLSRLR